MMGNKNNKQLEIEITPQTQEVYSNLAVISHSMTEFVCDFVSLLPGFPKAQVKSRIIMAPEHAKSLMIALQNNIQKYEEQFGEIENLNPQAPITMFGGGEA